MEHVSTDVMDGIGITEETALKFETILNGMEKLNPEMQEISNTARAFSLQTQELVGAIQQVLTIAQQTNEASEEIVGATEEQLAIMDSVATSAQSLTELAQSLQQSIKTFKI